MSINLIPNHYRCATWLQ